VTVQAAFLGLVIATLFIELTGFYPGGVIVPAFLALFVNQPLRLVGTIVVAVLAWLCFRAVERLFLVLGRRRFLLLVLLGGAWAFLGYRVLPQVWPESIELRAIGWVIPGLIANTIERQGLWTTLAAMAVASAMTYFALRLLSAV
jgi:poly-gamma-glutamate biosynthesis protein PgsC/CapC